MIPKSTYYKLVRESDRVIIAEGSAKDMRRAQKQTPGTFIVVRGGGSQIGQKFPNPTVAAFAPAMVAGEGAPQYVLPGTEIPNETQLSLL